MLNSLQVFSPDDQWVVYDTRNDQTHIGRTCCVEKVNINTGEIVRLYSAPGQTLNGPGVGAVAYHPREDKMIFIHGLLNCDAEKPYGFTRRFGAILDETIPGRISSAEARTVALPLVPGALRGGTHAHSWSGDGEWISFTYNDFLMEELEKSSGGNIKDLRTIGIMSPIRPVQVPQPSAENFSGTYFAVVAATVTEKPAWGSDEIEKAFDECWIGEKGYPKKDGSRQARAIAFQGNVRTAIGSLLTEVFVSDIPEDITRPEQGKVLEGTLTGRPTVPYGLAQRRVTFTADRKYPGLQGPRFWLRSSPDGANLYFLMKDDDGVVQVFVVSVNGGNIRQITDLPASVQAQFNVSPDGNRLALIADNSVWVVELKSGKSTRLTPRTADDMAPVLAVIWNNSGDALVYNRHVSGPEGRFLQIFSLELN
jgi:WD40 repeat protein